jgi:hypothetical protein
MVDVAEDDSQKVENWHFTLEQESLFFFYGAAGTWHKSK